MSKAPESKRSGRGGWKVLLGLGLVGPVMAGMSLISPIAFGEEEAVTHDHAAHAAGLEDELAQVRGATARFHRVEEAVAAGYELGWVNGSGVRIVAGCVSHPTAGAMGYHYFNAELMADNDVNALEPEVLVYAPAPDGGLRLVAVEWVRPKPSVQPSRRLRSPVGPRDGHAHPGATAWAGFLPHACLGVGQQSVGDVRGLEPGGPLHIAARRMRTTVAAIDPPGTATR